MVFGLRESEEGCKDLNQKIDVLAQLGEKPRFEATRLGKEKSGPESTRPVKVMLVSATSLKSKKITLIRKISDCVFIARQVCRGEG